MCPRKPSGAGPAARLRAHADLPRPARHPRLAAGRASRPAPPRDDRSDLARRYGYREIETPMFEQAAVFERGLGEVTDAVEKELFRLAPRTEEGEAWALRPEPTAGIVRAYVQHGMQTLPQPVKVTLTGPMFRYDRPQAGRFRQFWQFDVEAIGDPGPGVDAELIELALALLPRCRARRRHRPRQLDRRRELPPGLHRGADGVLPRPRRSPAAGRARPAREERAAAARLEGPGDGRAERRRAADHGPAVRRLRGALRRLPRPTSTRSGSSTSSSPGSSAASTTTRGPRSSSGRRPAAASSRRSAAAGGTTASSSCSAASRRRGSGSGWGWTGSCSRSRARAQRPPGSVPLAVVVGAEPGRDGRAAEDRDAPARRGPGDRRRPRAAQARPPARVGGQGRGPVRGDRRRRAGRREHRPAGPRRGLPEAGRRSPTCPALLRRKAGG